MMSRASSNCSMALPRLTAAFASCRRSQTPRPRPRPRLRLRPPLRPVPRQRTSPSQARRRSTRRRRMSGPKTRPLPVQASKARTRKALLLHLRPRVVFFFRCVWAKSADSLATFLTRARFFPSSCRVHALFFVSRNSRVRAPAGPPDKERAHAELYCSVEHDCEDKWRAGRPLERHWLLTTAGKGQGHKQNDRAQRTQKTSSRVALPFYKKKDSRLTGRRKLPQEKKKHVLLVAPTSTPYHAPQTCAKLRSGAWSVPRWWVPGWSALRWSAA